MPILERLQYGGKISRVSRHSAYPSRPLATTDLAHLAIDTQIDS